MHQSNSELACAFPAALRNDVLAVLSVLPESPRIQGTFSVRIADEVVVLPRRIYHDPAPISTASLTGLQRELVDCLLTRHIDGFVRQEHLQRIISANRVWIPPFVVRLAGEYVMEILHLIHQNLENLDRAIYGEFLKANPEFFAVTKQRAISYWNCYYRHGYRRTEYIGFRLMDFFESLLADNH